MMSSSIRVKVLVNNHKVGNSQMNVNINVIDLNSRPFSLKMFGGLSGM